MTILQIAVLAAIALIAGRLPKGRQLAMLAISAVAIFWLQPAQPFVSLGFWFPVATLGAAGLSWAITSTPEVRGFRNNWRALAILVAVPLLLDLGRYLRFENILVREAPSVPLVVAALLALAAAGALLARWQGASGVWRVVALLMIIATFVLLKSPALVRLAESFVPRSSLQGASTNATPLSWLGFSYIAFRLLHTIRDRQSGRLPPLSLSEYMNYAIFFPAFTAGPIDRAERFVRELRSPLTLNDEDWIDAGSRFFVGLFKKFVIADLLGVISISDQLAPLVPSPGWLWFFLYAYALRIYFDFSGYTDVAIGMGRLLGIRLPENFAAPYLKSNLTQFWNSWHMTLTQWFRSYVFNPLTRRMRSAERPAPVWVVILVGQLGTMLLIGLWHGITWNFAAWGLWHGVGLFIHNRWADLARDRMPAWTQARWGHVLVSSLGVFLTFNFVALGWLFFVLSSPSLSWQTVLRLFGLS